MDLTFLKLRLTLNNKIEQSDALTNMLIISIKTTR